MSTIDVEAESRRLINQPWMRTFLGAYVLGGYLRLTALTSKIIYDPPDLLERSKALEPALFITWHGSSTLGFLVLPSRANTNLLASLHPDGRMAAALARSFKLRVIDGQGINPRQREGTRAVAAYREMARALKAGQSLYVTGDTPPIPGRNMSGGAIRLARGSGRPLVPVATVASRRTILRSWDEMQVSHPFSRLGIVAGEPYFVGEDVSDDEAAAEFKRRLDATLARAFAVADREA